MMDFLCRGRKISWEEGLDGRKNFVSLQKVVGFFEILRLAVKRKEAKEKVRYIIYKLSERSSHI